MTSPGTAAVAIGGGHGLARTLAALRSVTERVTAIVTVADDGGSSGRLRRDLDVLPPGDLRMASTALADDGDLKDVLNYRFTRGELAGHSLGNLVLVALQDLASGDVVEALRRLGHLLGTQHRVLPCTTEAVTLHATTAGGEIVGQASVAATPRLQRVWLEPTEPAASPTAVRAVRDADLVVLGPGSLYTSLLPNLLVPGIGDALAASRAPVVYVANLRQQPGETEGMSLAAHLDALAAHLPALRIDVVVAHQGRPPSGPGAPLVVDAEHLRAPVPRLACGDLLGAGGGHDAGALATALSGVLAA